MRDHVGYRAAQYPKFSGFKRLFIIVRIKNIIYIMYVYSVYIIVYKEGFLI